MPPPTRTKAGDVTQFARAQHSATGDGRFPVFDAASAKAAINARGRAGPPGHPARSVILSKAAKFQPALAKAAKARDKAAQS